MEQRGKTIFRATLTGSIINAALIIMKFIAGIFGRIHGYIRGLRA